MSEQINIAEIKKAYFIGIGGIGMSALARYFLSIGIKVFGYDRTPTTLTGSLITEGCTIFYDDRLSSCLDDVDIVVYTPAISADSEIKKFYLNLGLPFLKRSEVLGLISKDTYNICVAGTHGKTTISTMVAHVLRDSGYGCNAFLGGISSNYNTNFWSSPNHCTVIEADEYDRSFLKLHPNVISISSMDPDHLDIYGTKEAMEEAFMTFAERLNPKGLLLTKKGLSKEAEFKFSHHLTYHVEQLDANIHTTDLRVSNGAYIFNVQGPDWEIKEVNLNMGGIHNVENSLVAIAISKYLGISDEKIVSAVASFKGVKRRFEYVVKTAQHVYIDDYAHHPEELNALISSSKKLYPEKQCTIIFQPHLFSRTRDLVEGFAKSLSMADKVVLLPIYPARELPIEGVTSALIADKMNADVALLDFEKVGAYVKDANPSLLITAGAGNIDQWVEPIKKLLMNQ